MSRKIFAISLLALLLSFGVNRSSQAQANQEYGYLLSIRTVYDAPGVDARVLGILDIGDRVEVIRKESIYHLVNGPRGLAGYIVYPKYSTAPLDLSEATSDNVAVPDQVVEEVDSEASAVSIRSHLLQPAKVRSEAGLFGKVLLELPRSTEVDILGRSNNWLLIRVSVADSVAQGYIHKAMLPAQLKLQELDQDAPKDKTNLAEL